MNMRWAFAGVSLLLVAGACGDGIRVSDQPRYTATTMVLESPDHGPELCLGGVGFSYPPQCGGHAVLGWDWDEVEGEESAHGTTWGTYRVVGTWDGDALTLTEPPGAPEPADPPEDDARSSTPCAEPDGGWRVVDEATTSEVAMDAAIAYARSQPTVGGVWLDQSINPALDEDPIDEWKANDPTRLILNITFTEDLPRHEQAIRQEWGGALCVSGADVSAARLAEIRAEVLAEIEDVLFGGIDELEGQVEIGVPVDYGLQQRLDERYGPGVVEVRAQLRPVTP